jgi:hypothetical protein
MTRPETIRTANRLGANEGKPVVLEGLAVDAADQACIHLDRSDAIVPVAGLSGWDDSRLGRPVRGRGFLSRHAAANDPLTGIASLVLTQATIELLPQPADGRIRTAPELPTREGSQVEIEGMAYRSRHGPILVIYGGLVYVCNLPDWDAVTVTRTVVVQGTLRHPPLPPGAPLAGGSWAIEATSFRNRR